ncbi:hypothetical protein SAMN05192544_107830, partial [Paraburkholderia hospita]
MLKAVTPDLTEIFAFDPAGNPIDAAKIPPYPDGLETEHERTARYARDAAEDAEWMRAHPGQKPFRLKGARRVWGVPLCDSSSGRGGFWLVEGAVAQHGEQHVAASSSESDERLIVALALLDLAR